MEQTKSPEQLAAIARLFSSSVISEMARRGRSELLARLVRQARLFDGPVGTASICDAFNIAFKLLQQDGCRHEYVYKSALIQEELLGRHCLQTATMLSEFRVGACKADLAILNGTAAAYEVKSERDSLVRLEKQIHVYSTVFASVHVLTAYRHLRSVLECVPKHVGVLCLNPAYRLSVLREAVCDPGRTSPLAILDSIRINEALSILASQNIAAPDVPNTRMRGALADVFARLDPALVHTSMVAVLKRTRNLLPLAQLIEQLPVCLQTAALSVALRRSDHKRLVDAVNGPLKDALGWE